jgi:hypothetical protein
VVITTLGARSAMSIEKVQYGNCYGEAKAFQVVTCRTARRNHGEWAVGGKEREAIFPNKVYPGQEIISKRKEE